MERRELTPLAKWLWRELEYRRESAREASLAAGLSHAAITRYLTGITPTPASAKKLAQHFEVPEELILQLAGHIKGPPDQDTFIKQLAQITEGWSEAERRTLVELARTLAAQRRELEETREAQQG